MYQPNQSEPMKGIPPFNMTQNVRQTVQLETWSTDLCGCFDDQESCCLTLFCPCISFGRIANIVDQGQASIEGSAALWCGLCLFGGMQWIYTCLYRQKLRFQLNLPETPCCDCCVEYCCECCSLCQMYRELKHRGFNMESGYLANLERMGGGMQPPPSQGGMTY